MLDDYQSRNLFLRLDSGKYLLPILEHESRLWRIGSSESSAWSGLFFVLGAEVATELPTAKLFNCDLYHGCQGPEVDPRRLGVYHMCFFIMSHLVFIILLSYRHCQGKASVAR